MTCYIKPIIEIDNWLIFTQYINQKKLFFFKNINKNFSVGDKKLGSVGLAETNFFL